MWAVSTAVLNAYLLLIFLHLDQHVSSVFVILVGYYAFKRTKKYACDL